ncbi:hypothetical protein K7X08_033131 [Anisodus acutangulus]|uniref:Uncharacterized protein n=1 Tax=Anisodus acutangulus TaxID=402998 RepID=A0A9Q1M611_9SOLA|nr:hypothetical protein K7X08_033131 [Anisodus acutangulus]
MGDQQIAVSLNISDEDSSSRSTCTFVTVPFIQKIIAETIGTYFLIFAGCGSVAVNADKGMVTFPGISIVWGLVVMVMVYSVGHISGAHFNPAVTIAFASNKRFPWKQVPAYVAAQVIGSTLASGTLRLIFNGKHDHFVGTSPTGSDIQSLVLEFIITFYLMFVISGVATDNRAIGELAGLAVGATVLLNVMFAGPISGASMNPARSLGPAIVSSHYKGLWVYMLGPTSGAIAESSCMAEISDVTVSHATASDIKDDNVHHILSCPCLASKKLGDSSSLSSGCSETISFTQKLVAELLGTYLLMFAGFAAMVVNKNMSHIGKAALWGLNVMVMIYTVGHASGAHFNPSVTIAFATCKRIAWRHVPAYVLVQVGGATLATRTVRLMFKEEQPQFLGTVPAGSDLQSLGLEFLITFYLMFAVAGIATDNRAVGELNGLVIGAVVTINSILAGPISGASMNPARSLGPAILSNCYRKQWIYILGPTAGAIAGIWFHNAMKSVKPYDEVTKFFSFLRRLAQNKVQKINTTVLV